MAGYVSAGLYMFIVFGIMLTYRVRIVSHGKIGQTKKRFKIGLFGVLIFSFAMVLLNAFCTMQSVGYGGDRTSYFADFIGRQTDWQGVNLAFSIWRSITTDFHVVLYGTTFICFFVAFCAHNISEDTTQRSLLFLLASDFLTVTFVSLKQCYVVIFSMLFFALIMQKKTIKRDVCCTALAVSSSLFHSTGFLLFPILISFWMMENDNKKIKFLIIPILLSFIFFKPLLMFVSKLVQSNIPHLSVKILEYFGAETKHTESTATVFVKGIPYYILFLWGAFRRKQLSLIYPKYDSYLVLASLGAILGLASVYSYWMIRFVIIFAFPMGILYSMLMEQSNKITKYCMGGLIVGLRFAITLRSMILVYINYKGY